MHLYLMGIVDGNCRVEIYIHLFLDIFIIWYPNMSQQKLCKIYVIKARNYSSTKSQCIDNILYHF